jgi:hypothetical protein
MDDDFLPGPTIDEDELIAQIKLGLEQSARGEGRPVSEYLAEARARLKLNFPDAETETKTQRTERNADHFHH